MRILRKFFAVAVALTCLVSAAPAYSAVSYISASAAQETAASASAVQVFASSEEAAEYLRTQLVQRNPEVTLTLSSKEGLTGGELMNKIVDLAVAETGVSNEGDYLRMSMAGHGGYIRSTANSVTLNISIDYYTTAEQEKYVSDRIASILSLLRLSDKSDYEKILSVYKWVTANVAYSEDFENDIVYTAYGALHNGASVCQGYAQLTYRMLRELGVNVRMITGTGTGGGNHVWLIAEADGWYYYIDPTYDGGMAPADFMFFMKGTEDFDLGAEKHVPSYGDPKLPHLEPNYHSEEFASAYPIHDTAYDISSPAYRLIPGDVDLNGMLDAFDNTALRQGMLYGFNTDRARLAADIDGDGYVKINDLVLLQSFLTGKIREFPE